MFKRKNTRKESMRYSEAKQVKVSIIFTRLGEIDTINERFSCEATLFISWQENIEMLKKCDSENSEDDTYYWDPKNFWDPQLYIDNAIGEVKEKDVKFRLEKNWDYTNKEWFFEVHMIKKIQGTFFEKLELYHFPFDVQDLSLTLTSHRTSNEIYLSQDYNIMAKMTKSASLDKHIWKLYDHVNIKLHTIKNDIPQASDYYSESYDTICSYSAVTMQCRVSRKPGYFVINCLLPTLMITLCVFFTFMMDHKRYQYRFSLLFTTMLTSITFRWAIHGRVLPTISYLTFLDVYCVSSILIVFSAMIWHTIYLVIYKEDKELAEKCDRYSMFAFAVAVVIEHIGQTIWFFIALQKRIALEKLDKQAVIHYAKLRNDLKRQEINNEQQENVNSLQSKRLMYSFNKLDDSSVITIVSNINNPKSIVKDNNEKQNLTEFEEQITDIPFISQNGLIANQNNNITITPKTRTLSCKKASFKDITGEKEHFIPVRNYLPLTHQYSKES